MIHCWLHGSHPSWQVGEGVIQGFAGVSPITMAYRDGSRAPTPLSSRYLARGMFCPYVSHPLNSPTLPLSFLTTPASTLHRTSGTFLGELLKEISAFHLVGMNTLLCAAPRSGAPEEGRAPQGCTTQPYWISASITCAEQRFPKARVENKTESLNICRWHSEPRTLLPISATDTHSKYLLRNS